MYCDPLVPDWPELDDTSPKQLGTSADFAAGRLYIGDFDASWCKKLFPCGELQLGTSDQRRSGI